MATECIKFEAIDSCTHPRNRSVIDESTEYFAHKCATLQRKLSPHGSLLRDPIFHLLSLRWRFLRFRLSSESNRAQRRFVSFSCRNALSMSGGPTVSYRWWSRPPVAGKCHETLPVSFSKGYSRHIGDASSGCNSRRTPSRMKMAGLSSLDVEVGFHDLRPADPIDVLLPWPPHNGQVTGRVLPQACVSTTHVSGNTPSMFSYSETPSATTTAPAHHQHSDTTLFNSAAAGSSS